MTISIKQLNYTYFAFIILWLPFNLTFLNIDGKGRIPILITIIMFFVNVSQDKSFIKKHIISSPTYLWFIWVLYTTINLLLKGYKEEVPFIYFVLLNLIIPFFTMVLARKETIRNREKTLKFLSIVFLIFTLLSITTIGSNLGQSTTISTEEERSLGIMGNIGPLISLFLIFFMGLRYVNKWINIRVFIPFVIFTTSLVVLSGARKAFGALLLILLAVAISRFKLTFKNMLLSITLVIGVDFGYNYIMDQTIIGERFEKGIEQGERFNTTDHEVLSFLGDRATFYINGWALFLDNPLSGVGIKNYRHATNSNYVLHTEYIVQLAEGGIIGAALFLLFYFAIGKKIIRSWKLYKYRRGEIWIIIGTFLAIVFINITAWTYSFPHYFLVFGVILGYLENIKMEENNLKYYNFNRKKQSDIGNLNTFKMD